MSFDYYISQVMKTKSIYAFENYKFHLKFLIENSKIFNKNFVRNNYLICLVIYKEYILADSFYFFKVKNRFVIYQIVVDRTHHHGNFRTHSVLSFQASKRHI